jgi:uncharacterized membrane protein
MRLRAANGTAIREYAAGSLWVVPAVCAAVALVAGLLLSQVRIPAGSPLAPLVFEGTADDARTLLIAIASTVVTVIALVLGLTVVALQLSSTQFSPRLLRNFLRDGATQWVLGVYLATFAYSAAGLYTVGVAAGQRVEDFPRLAVTGAMVLLFATLGMVVYFADHLAHSLQIDRIAELVQTSTLEVVRSSPGTSVADRPTPPDRAVPIPALRSGYVETAQPHRLLPLAAAHHATVLIVPWVGQHVIEGMPIAWVWSAAGDPPPPPAEFQRALGRAVRIGFERTLEQDCGFGMRQLVDIACKALSPAVNDPYTAVQAIEHLEVVCCALAARPLGDDVAGDPASGVAVVMTCRRFEEYLELVCGLLRRYGSHEPTVLVAILHLLASCAARTRDDDRRTAALRREAALVLGAAERTIDAADLEQVRRAAARLPSPRSTDGGT